MRYLCSACGQSDALQQRLERIEAHLLDLLSEFHASRRPTPLGFKAAALGPTAVAGQQVSHDVKSPPKAQPQLVWDIYPPPKKRPITAEDVDQFRRRHRNRSRIIWADEENTDFVVWVRSRPGRAEPSPVKLTPMLTTLLVSLLRNVGRGLTVPRLLDALYEEQELQTLAAPKKSLQQLIFKLHIKTKHVLRNFIDGESKPGTYIIKPELQGKFILITSPYENCGQIRS